MDPVLSSGPDFVWPPILRWYIASTQNNTLITRARLWVEHRHKPATIGGSFGHESWAERDK